MHCMGQSGPCCCPQTTFVDDFSPSVDGLGFMLGGAVGAYTMGGVTEGPRVVDKGRILFRVLLTPLIPGQ